MNRESGEVVQVSKDGERIQTTVGDLICAISDAASEAEVQDDELWELTSHIFNKVVSKR